MQGGRQTPGGCLAGSWVRPKSVITGLMAGTAPGDAAPTCSTTVPEHAKQDLHGLWDLPELPSPSQQRPFMLSAVASIPAVSTETACSVRICCIGPATSIEANPDPKRRLSTALITITRARLRLRMGSFYSRVAVWHRHFYGRPSVGDWAGQHNREPSIGRPPRPFCDAQQRAPAPASPPYPCSPQRSRSLDCAVCVTSRPAAQ